MTPPLMASPTRDAFARWAALRDDPDLAAAARSGLGEADRPSPALIERLRRRWPADLVADALTQAALARRARAKFGAAAPAALTADGLEQATRPELAALRAARFGAWAAQQPGPAGPIADLCCGIGADLIALDAAIPPRATVLGVERDPWTARAAAANTAGTRVRVVCADVRALRLDRLGAAFIDPARRSGGARRFDPAAYSPPLGFVEQLASVVPATGAKVAPGLPHEAIPPGAEAQWVSWRGALKETALWFGPLAGARRRATVLTGTGSGAGPHHLTDADLPAQAAIPGLRDGVAPPVGPLGAVLYEPDPAVIRAGLVAAVAAALPGGRLLDPRIAYVTADEHRATPFAAAFAVQDQLPYSERALRAALRERRIGRAEIKVRGLDIDPAALRRRLRLSGDEECTVLLARRDAGPIAVLAHRIR